MILSVPVDSAGIDEIRQGTRNDLVVPLPAGSELAVGQMVEFQEAILGPAFCPIPLPRGERIQVKLDLAREEPIEWAGYRLWFIGWKSLNDSQRDSVHLYTPDQKR